MKAKQMLTRAVVFYPSSQETFVVGPEDKDYMNGDLSVRHIDMQQSVSDLVLVVTRHDGLQLIHSGMPFRLEKMETE